MPAALCGCDVLAVAETGSRKRTLAFGWPLLAHVAAQEARAVPNPWPWSWSRRGTFAWPSASRSTAN